MILKDAPGIPLSQGDTGYVFVTPNVTDYLLSPMVIPRLRHVYMTDR